MTMSEIELIEVGIPDLLPMEDRSPGLHVSHIIHDMCLKLGHYTQQDMNMSRLQLGCALEHAIAQRYHASNPGRYVILGELELDDIYGTPDFYDIEMDEPVETKFTWMSSKWPPTSDKFLKYWWQLGAYCHMTGSLSGRLIKVHANGDYKKFDVVAHHWRRKWTRQELRNHWQMLKDHGERMLEMKENV